jgi:hypothetical protein
MVAVVTRACRDHEGAAHECWMVEIRKDIHLAKTIIAIR